MNWFILMTVNQSKIILYLEVKESRSSYVHIFKQIYFNTSIGTTTPGQSEHGINGDENILHTPQISCRTGS